MRREDRRGEKRKFERNVEREEAGLESLQVLHNYWSLGVSHGQAQEREGGR